MQLALEQSYERLRHLERLRDDLVHMMVHDLRSPLSALIYNLGFMREGLTDKVPNQVIQDIDAGEAAARAMIGLANDLLDVSRLETDRLPVQRARADLLGVVHSAVWCWKT